MNNLNAAPGELSLTGLMTEELFYLPSEQAPASLQTQESDNQTSLEKSNPRKISGEGKKRILLISPAFGEDRAAYISLADNILKSVKLDISAAFLLETGSTEPEEIPDLLTEFNPRLIISFGAEKVIRNWPDEALLNMTWKSGTCTFFRARSLEELKSSVGEKKLFWATLSKLFQISK